jgi:DNA-binding transcriptional LysR family regulator
VTANDYQHDRVKLHQLRYFIAVADELHFRRAAERLHMSQPPLSEAIRELEATIGAQLLERSRRRVALTAAGEVLLRDARALLGDLDRALETARRIGTGQAGRLRLSFVGSALYGVVPDLLRAFSLERPDIELQLQERSTTEQLAALAAGDLDIGFVRAPAAAEGLTSQTIMREPTVAALPGGHPLSTLKRIPVARLSTEPFVLFPREQAPELHDAIMSAIAADGRLPRIVQEVAEMQTIIGLVASGMGVSLVPGSVQALARTGVVYRPVVGAPRSDLAMVTRRADTSPMVRAFAETARLLRDRGIGPLFGGVHS